MNRPPAARRRTPLHYWHRARARAFTERHGWEVPLVYSEVPQEIGRIRQGLALADVSHLCKTRYRGQAVREVARHYAGSDALDRLGTAANLEAIRPGLGCRLAADHLLLLAETEGDAEPADFSAGLIRVDATSALACFQILGPEVDRFLARLVALDPRTHLSLGSCTETALANLYALLIRLPRPAESSVAIGVGWDVAEYVWGRLLEAGREWGIGPVGQEALQTTGVLVLGD
jgi:glycine cleavage system aminomethyltransferase T